MDKWRAESKCHGGAREEGVRYTHLWVLVLVSLSIQEESFSKFEVFLEVVFP